MSEKSININTKVRIYLVDEDQKKLVEYGENTLCQPGIKVFNKALAGNRDYKATHIVGMFSAVGVGAAPSLDKYSTYTDFLSQATSLGYDVESVEIRNYSYTDYNPTPGTDTYDDNILTGDSARRCSPTAGRC